MERERKHLISDKIWLRVRQLMQKCTASLNFLHYSLFPIQYQAVSKLD